MGVFEQVVPSGLRARIEAIQQRWNLQLILATGGAAVLLLLAAVIGALTMDSGSKHVASGRRGSRNVNAAGGEVAPGETTTSVAGGPGATAAAAAGAAGKPGAAAAGTGARPVTKLGEQSTA